MFILGKLTKLKQTITNRTLADALGLSSYKLPMQFFSRSDYMKQFININKNERVTTYNLTDKGKEAITLIEYFKKFYSSL